MGTRKTTFDRKFGCDFMKSVPLTPGVYEMLDPAGVTIYVGKAKILRRRLQQYRNARRCKRHHKMKLILQSTASIRITPCDSDLSALLLENQLIQKLRPRFNVSGAFSFLYPVIGIKRFDSNLYFTLTASPQHYSGFNLYGAYRSRYITRNAYFSLLGILGHIGHREPTRRLKNVPAVKYSHIAGFRQISDHWLNRLDEFLKGNSTKFLEDAVTALLEKPRARRCAEEVQEWINDLKYFYKFETSALRKALHENNLRDQFVPQEERDQLFIKTREKRNSRILNAEVARRLPSQRF